MEHIIAKLLQDFERGKLNRRQLIHSLALSATAASAVSAMPRAAAADPKFKSVSVNHIVLDVKDYTKSRDFYTGLLGMTLVKDYGTQCRLRFGDTILLARNRTANTPRVDHIGIGVENWNKKAMEAELKLRGLLTQWDGRAPIEDDDSTHVKDPDGFHLQIGAKDYQPLERSV